MTSEKVGFIGLGRMGLPMAYRLLRNGFPLTVHNRSQAKKRQIASDGAHLAGSAAQVTQGADFILACLPDVAAVEAVFLGQDGVIANCRQGQVLIDHSTVGIATSKAIAAAAEERGARFLDAPISGGTERAVDGTLTIMVGGPNEAYQRALPLFQAMGTTIRHMGPSGTGTAVKLVNQLLVGIHSVAAAEALLLAARSGADPETVLEVVDSGWGHSFILGRNAPVMTKREFQGERVQLKMVLKDLQLIRDFARDVDSPTPAGDLSLQLFQEAIQRGLGDLDLAAIVLPLEQQAGVQIQRRPQ